MNNLTEFPVNVSCQCGARIVTTRYQASDALKAEQQFLTAHLKCNELSVYEQVFGKDGAVKAKQHE